MTTGSVAPDRAVIHLGDVTQELTVDAFTAMPLDRQVELLMTGGVTFFAGQTQLRTLDALKVLREAKAQQVAARVNGTSASKP